MHRKWLAAAILAAAIAGCGQEAAQTEDDGANEITSNGSTSQTGAAVATLQTADGEPAGTATVRDAEGAIGISLAVEGLPPGRHGAHIHMTGNCQVPTFESAGAHWNPANRQHGLESPDGPHAGDMPNLDIGGDGRGSLDYVLQGGTLADLFDSDGAALVVHANADDQVTDPSGNSGDRIACGVFRAQPSEA